MNRISDKCLFLHKTTLWIKSLSFFKIQTRYWVHFMLQYLHGDLTALRGFLSIFCEKHLSRAVLDGLSGLHGRSHGGSELLEFTGSGNRDESQGRASLKVMPAAVGFGLGALIYFWIGSRSYPIFI